MGVAKIQKRGESCVTFRKWLFLNAREPTIAGIASRLLADPATARLPDFLCHWDDHLIARGSTGEELDALQQAWDRYDAAENADLDAFVAEVTRQSLERRRSRQVAKRRQILS